MGVSLLLESWVDMPLNDQMQHPSFPQPSDENVLVWRYLTFDKFKWLVEESRLYMPCLFDFQDQLEGRSPNGQKDWWTTTANSETNPDRKKIILDNFKKIESFAESFRKKYFVSCWHLNDFESPKMWGEYANTYASVAIKTTYKRLANALPNYLNIGMVRYINYKNDRLPETFNLFDYVMHKDNDQFGLESEVRVIAVPPVPAFAEDHKHFFSNLFEKASGQKNYVFAPPVELNDLFDDVIIRPRASAEEQQLIADFCRKHKVPPPRVSECEACDL